MRMCCEWMSNGLKRMNDSGVAPVPRREFGHDIFVIRFRSMDIDAVARLSSYLPSGTPFASGGDLAINHCPGCGVRLSDWISDHPEDFEEILRQVID